MPQPMSGPAACRLALSDSDTRIVGRLSTKMRSSIANDAAFEPTERKPVMGVGAPSYTSGAHMWNGTAAILKPMPATTRMTASTRRGSRFLPCQRGRDRAQVRRARQAVHERHAVEQDAERERAEQEILHRRFVRAPARLQESRQDVERDRHRLEADEERDQIGPAGHEHHAERGAQNQEVVLARPRAFDSRYRRSSAP